MSSQRIKVILSPLAVEYQEMKKRAAREDERARMLAAARPTEVREIGDRVTLSSAAEGSPEETAGCGRTLSQPVTCEERNALMQAFSIHV